MSERFTRCWYFLYGTERNWAGRNQKMRQTFSIEKEGNPINSFKEQYSAQRK